MIETINSRVKKLEGIQGAPPDETVKFRVFGVEAVGDGSYRRTNLKTGNVKVMPAAQLNIEPYTPKEGPAPAALPRGATLETVAVSEQAPEPAPEAGPSPGEALDAYVAAHGGDCSIECAMETRRLVEAVKAARLAAAGRHVPGVWQ